MRSIAAVVAGLILSLLFEVAAVTVTINNATEYQTIEGFGAHGAENVWWSSGPFASPSFVATVVDELGMTMNRNEFYPDFEPVNDNGDPDVLNWPDGFNFSGIFVNRQQAWITALRDKAAQSGEPMRFITTFWSPPAWMKTNNSTTDGGSLKVGIERELAEYTIAMVRAYKERCNIDIYAHSMQNEPAFAQYFNSCVYTAESYRDMMKAVGPIVHAAYPDLKFFGPEDMLGAWVARGFPGRVMADPDARAQMWAIAVHGYSDGVNPTPGSQAAQLWATAHNNMRTTGKPLWMTETSGYANNWTGAKGTADAIFSSLKYGKISAWVWWQLSGNHTAGEILMPLGQKGKLFYAAKQYFRYIRPGAVMIEVNADDTEVFTLGFHHKEHKTLTLVLLNWASSAKSVTLSGETLPSFTWYRTSSSDDCVNAGTVGSTLTLPANSINTLYGSNYEPPLPVAQLMQGSRPRGEVRAEIFGIDGRLLAVIDRVTLDASGGFSWDGRTSGTPVAVGVYCARVTDIAGRSAHATATVISR